MNLTNQHALPTLMALLCLPAFIACGRGAQDSGDGPASVELAIAEIPADVSCFQVSFEGPATVTRSFPVKPGGPTSYRVLGLPEGETVVRGAAYQQPCGTLPSATAATWLSDPVNVVLVRGRPSLISLTLRRNVEAHLVATFDDGPQIAPADERTKITTPTLRSVVGRVKASSPRFRLEMSASSGDTTVAQSSKHRLESGAP